jgi:hypothetical protein
MLVYKLGADSAVGTPCCRMTTAKVFRLALHKKPLTLNAKFSCVESLSVESLAELK